MGIAAIVQYLAGWPHVNTGKQRHLGQFLKVIQYRFKVFRLNVLQYVDATHQFRRLRGFCVLRYANIVAVIGERA